MLSTPLILTKTLPDHFAEFLQLSRIELEEIDTHSVTVHRTLTSAALAVSRSRRSSRGSEIACRDAHNLVDGTTASTTSLLRSSPDFLIG